MVDVFAEYEKRKKGHDRTFRIGRVLRRWKEHSLAGLLPIVFFSVFLNIPALLFEFLIVYPSTAETDLNLSVWSAIFVLQLISLMIYAVMNTVLIGVIAEPIGKSGRGSAEWLSHGFKALVRHGPALFIMGLLSTIALFFGFLVLIIPGLMLACVWSVICPVLVLENTGISDAFSRSTSLTRGFRWWVLLILIIMWTLQTAVLFGGYFIADIWGWTDTGYQYLQFEDTGSILYYVFQNTLEFLSVGFAAVLTVSLYEELRYIRDGDDISELAEIFD